MSLLFWRKKKEVPMFKKVSRNNTKPFVGGAFVGGVPTRKLSLIENEKKIKRFLSHKIAHSKSLDKPNKIATSIYKWLLNNL